MKHAVTTARSTPTMTLVLDAMGDGPEARRFAGIYQQLGLAWGFLAQDCEAIGSDCGGAGVGDSRTFGRSCWR
jgi:hypothetical protein